MNLDLVKHTKDYIEKMDNGINPLNGEKVSSNDLINNVRINRCLFYINNVLEKVLNNGGVTRYNHIKKSFFYLNRESLNKYDYNEGDLSISKIIKKMLLKRQNIANLKIISVYNYLISIGLIYEIDVNGKKSKRQKMVLI